MCKKFKARNYWVRIMSISRNNSEIKSSSKGVKNADTKSVCIEECVW